jgi:hypothetical protein
VKRDSHFLARARVVARHITVGAFSFKLKRGDREDGPIIVVMLGQGWMGWVFISRL